MVTGEPQVALPLAKPHEFLELGHLLCGPGRDRVEALQASAYIVIQAVGDSVLSLKCHGVSPSKSYGRLICPGGYQSRWSKVVYGVAGS